LLLSVWHLPIKGWYRGASARSNHAGAMRRRIAAGRYALG
jgi:hypothetical protein